MHTNKVARHYEFSLWLPWLRCTGGGAAGGGEPGDGDGRNTGLLS